MNGYTPVVDTSQHNAPVDNRVMLRRGVGGRILRICHGFTLDRTVIADQRNCLEAGYRPTDLGYYPFINPKRGRPAPSARFMLDKIQMVHGHLDTFVMYDCETFIDQPPLNVPAIRGAEYTDWMFAFDETVRVEAPHMRRLMYTNAAFWNPWTNFDPSFGELDLLCARYPIYPSAATQRDPARLAAWIATSPKPPTDATLWAQWVHTITTKRPELPAGWSDWAGWQFSAGYNRQGAMYGAGSDDLDLCIVHTEKWKAWTQPLIGHVERPVDPPVVVHPPTPQEDDMKLRIISNGDDASDPYRWVTNGLVRVVPNEASLDWLTRTGQIEPGQSIVNPEPVSASVLAALPVVSDLGAPVTCQFRETPAPAPRRVHLEGVVE